PDPQAPPCGGQRSFPHLDLARNLHLLLLSLEIAETLADQPLAIRLRRPGCRGRRVLRDVPDLKQFVLNPETVVPFAPEVLLDRLMARRGRRFVVPPGNELPLRGELRPAPRR